MLKLLKKAGCKTLIFGLQSAHPEILKNINRSPEEPAELEKIIIIARQLGFFTSVGFIFGLPGETRETIQHSINYALSLKPTAPDFFNLAVLRNSDIYEKYTMQNKELCSLSKDEINSYCEKAAGKFYKNPIVIFRITKFILKNPSWLWVIMRFYPTFLKRTGFIKPQKDIAQFQIVK